MADRIYRGRVGRVLTPNLVEVDIDLGLGVRVLRRIVLNNYSIGSDASGTMHCLVILIGGKSVFVKVDDETIDGHVRGTIYSLEVRATGDAMIPAKDIPEGKVRDVIDWMEWSATNNHNPRIMRTAMKG